MTADRVELTDLTFSLVGPGKVGSSLAAWATARGARLTSVASRTGTRDPQLSDLLGGRSIALGDLTTRQDDLLLISVTDTALDDVAEQLSQRHQAPVVLHTSGRRSAEILGKLRRAGSEVGTLHPLKAFPRILQDPAEAAGVVFGIDGDPSAELLARRLALAWGGIPAEVPARARSLYHLAATTAAGGVVTLVASAIETARRAGVDPAIAHGYLTLAEQSLRQARTTETVTEAITGPVARGDLRGYERQLAELRSIDPDLAELLEMLAKRTLSLLAQRP